MVDYPEHLPGFSYVGRHRYSLTFCTFERVPYFKDSSIVSATCAQIMRAAGKEGIEITAYCFMPDHVHLIVEGRAEASDLKRFIARAKQYSGYDHSKAHPRQRLWQRYGFEHVIRDNESAQRAVRYVLENPVRKGLVTHPREYQFIGSSVFNLEQLMEFAYAVEAG